MILRSLPLATALTGAGTGAMTARTVSDGPAISAMTSVVPAYAAIGAAIEECAGVDAELDLRKQGTEALAANPALRGIISGHDDAIVPVRNEGTIRPLDDLVAGCGQAVKDNRLIGIDGEAVAVAFDMILDLKHLLYREDIIADPGLEPPAACHGMLADAGAIRAPGLVEFPLAMTQEGDRNIAAAFDDMYAARDDAFVDAALRPKTDNAAGVGMPELFRRVSGRLVPDYLIACSTAARQQLRQGKTGMAVLWASRAGAMDDAAASAVVGKVAGAIARLPDADTPPSSVPYRDRLAIGADISNAAEERAFRLIVRRGDVEVVAAESDAAVRLAERYASGRMAQAATETVGGGTTFSLSAIRRGMVIAAVDDDVPCFMTGARSRRRRPSGKNLSRPRARPVS